MTERLSLRQLKDVSLDFRNISSRYIRSDFSDAIYNLRRLLSFLQETPLLSDFITANHSKDYDIEAIVRGLDHRERYPIPTDRSEEIDFTYQLLKYFGTLDDMWGVVFNYAWGSSKVQDNLDAFNRSVVMPFVEHITRYLSSLLDEAQSTSAQETNFQIGSVNQLNLAQNGSTIIAVNTSTAQRKVEEAAQRLLAAVAKDNVEPEVKTELQEIAECAQSEGKSDKPKKSILRMCLERLPMIVSTAKVGVDTIEAGKELVESLTKFMHGS